MRASLLAVAFAVAGCGVVSEPTAARRAELVGGAVDDGGFRDVVMLRAVFTTDAGVSQGFACSGTLITPRVVLTAAHCLNEAGGPPGTTLTAMTFHDLDVAPPTSSPLWQAATSWRRHPAWSAATPMNNDVGLVLLPAPLSGVTPAPYLNRPLTSADVGAPMLVVGYGITSSGGSGAGTRRWVSLPLRGLTTQNLQLGNFTSAGICNGDSGGPSFITARDGVRRVAGVHSYTQPAGNCMDGLDARVDLFGAFIRQFITDVGGATCVEDGLCATGCATPDPDCVCVADGTCNGQCQNLLSDPDCPADCVADATCSTQPCPRPDPDCHAELAACSADTECQFRACATDPQRPQRYCSRPCAAGCQSGTSCVGSVCLQPQLPSASEGAPCTIGATFCTGSTVCTAPPQAPTTCRATCTSDQGCAATHECIPGQNGVRLCEPKPPEAVPGAPCIIGVTRCLGGSLCAPAGADVRCRQPCTTDATCATSDACADADAGVRVCVPRVAAGAACTPGVSRCVTPLVCGALATEAPTCRPTCATDSDCAAIDECVSGQPAVRVCARRPPQADAGEPCTAGLTRCLGGTSCTGFSGEPTRCLETCLIESDCLATEYCAAAQHDAGVCRPQPIFVEPIQVATSPAPRSGCAVIGREPLVALLALLLRRRRS